jgi:signal transduction histidine kinase/CheY-like chemotaxis protein
MKLRFNITVKLLGYLLIAGIVPLMVLGLSSLEISKSIVLEQARAENLHVVGGFASYLGLYQDQVEDLATGIGGNEIVGESLRIADQPATIGFDRLNLRAKIGYTLNTYVRVKGLVSIDLFSVGGAHFQVGETLTIGQAAPEVVSTLFKQSNDAVALNFWRGIGPNINPGSRFAQVNTVIRTIRHFSPLSGKTDVVGVLVISLVDDIMQEYLSRVPLPKGQVLMQLDRNGRIVLHSDTRRVGEVFPPVLLDMVRQQKETQSFRLDGQEVLMDVGIAGPEQGYIVLITPRELVTKRVNLLYWTTAGLILLGLLGVLALTLRYGRTVVAPIRAVSGGFRRLDVTPQVAQDALPTPRADDEIGQLVEGYNKHLRALKAQHEASVELKAARNAADEANQAKSAFLANMSHEIRTPMNAILGLLKMMQNTEMSDRQRDYIAKTDGAARSLLGLLNDILDFSKVEAGKMSLDPRPFHLDKMLRDLSVVLSPNLEGKPIEVRFDVNAQVPRGLLGDDMRLLQVLINLGGNAIKFTQQGEVVLSVRVVQQDVAQVMLEFSVSDTGIGIESDKQAHIFSGFSQAESSTTRRFGGTGLGLSISKRLVTLLGGDLQLESTLGKGSRFYFQLPFELAECEDAGLVAVASDGDKRSQPRRLAGMRLLVVEDNKINQMVAESLLSREGARITLADNGQLGVDAVANHPEGFDAVLMDIQMPVMDGYTATRTIRTELGRDSLPIIAMTANAMPSDRAACLEAGMDEHIGKPFDLDVLVTLLLRFSGRQLGALPPSTPVAPARGPAPDSIVSQPPVLDLSTALQRFGGDQGMLHSMFRSFARDALRVPKQLQDQLAADDVEQAARTLHTLKGLAATVGAGALAAQVAALEKSVKAHIAAPELDVRLTTLRSAIDEALEAIDKELNSHTPLAPEHAGTLSDQDVQSELQKLRDLLRNSNMGAIDAFNQLKSAHGGQLPDSWTELKAAIDELDFVRAAAACDLLLIHDPTPDSGGW